MFTWQILTGSEFQALSQYWGQILMQGGISKQTFEDLDLPSWQQWNNCYQYQMQLIMCQLSSGSPDGVACLDPILCWQN